jgi:FkbM family methyltransferase
VLPETFQSRDSWLRFPADPLRRGLALQAQTKSIAETPQDHHTKGANVGNTSCLFADALKPGFKVYSFEPDPANFQMLSELIRRENLSDRVIAMNSAVGSSDGRIELWHNEKHSGDHRVATEHFKNSLPGSSQIFSAPVVSVDSFAKTNNL